MRQAALGALAARFRDDPDTKDLLYVLARDKDRPCSVRRTAVEDLAADFHVHPEIKGLLQMTY